MNNETLNKYELGKEMFLQGKTIMSISKELKISNSRFSKYLRECGINSQKHHKNDINDTIFDKIDTEEKAYWLGFMFADGCISSNRNTIELVLAPSEYIHLEKFKDFLQWSGNVKVEENRSRVSFRNNHIKEALISHGCTPKKSLTLQFPTTVPNELIHHFIRGYFDGDGCICHTEKTLEISMISTYNFLNEVCNIMDIDKNRIYDLDRRRNSNRIVLGGKKDIEKFLDFIYQDAHIYLDRKYEKYKNLKIAVFNRDIKDN